MKKLVSRLRSRAGETFTEILAAILIVALASMLMASMVTASQGLDTSARRQDKEFYEAIENVESKAAPTGTSGQMTITDDATPSTPVTVNVTVYSDDADDGTLFAYEG